MTDLPARLGAERFLGKIRVTADLQQWIGIIRALWDRGA